MVSNQSEIVEHVGIVEAVGDRNGLARAVECVAVCDCGQRIEAVGGADLSGRDHVLNDASGHIVDAGRQNDRVGEVVVVISRLNCGKQIATGIQGEVGGCQPLFEALSIHGRRNRPRQATGKRFHAGRCANMNCCRCQGD